MAFEAILWQNLNQLYLTSFSATFINRLVPLSGYISKVGASNTGSTALAVPVFKERKWSRINFNLGMCL